MTFVGFAEGKRPIRLAGASADRAVITPRTAVLRVEPSRVRSWQLGALAALERTRARGLASRRALAAAADVTVCALLAIAANVVLSLVLGAVPSAVEAPVAALAVVLVIATPLAYLVVGESRYQQTLGKRLAGLAVAGVDGEPLPYRASAERLVVRVSPVTWVAVIRSSLMPRHGERVASPYTSWTRSIVVDLHGARATPSDRAPALAARVAQPLCRCEALRRLEGADAERYAVSHLVALARFPDHGRASLFCQDSATAWFAHEDISGDGQFRLDKVAQLPPVISPR